MFVVASTLASAWAAGPFEVRRGLQGSSLDGTADVSIVTSAPFDETVLRSHDASSYFYAVFDASGSQLDISVDKLAGTGVVRLGFDDGDPQSAPVSASASSVAASPASIQAGGVEFTTITIVPRDADGAMLGRGLAVSVDAALLWPVNPTGPIQDMGDGRYVVEGTAMVPGTGLVRATAEGVVLASSPTVESTSAFPGSLRDLAILQLLDLTKPGGRLDTKRLRGVRNQCLATIRTLGSDDPNRDDNALKTDLDGAMQALEDLHIPEAEALADDLIEIAWMIAKWNVDQAHAACGVCPKADAALAEADAKRAAGDGDWSGVVDAYAWAVEMSIQEMQHCGP
jgi:invasin-like protein